MNLKSTRDAAAELGVSHRRMLQLLKDGRVHGVVKVGHSYVIPSPVKTKPGTRGPIGVAGKRSQPRARRSR